MIQDPNPSDPDYDEYASDEEIEHYQSTGHDSFDIVYHGKVAYAKCAICEEEFECVGREYSPISNYDGLDRTDPGYWKDNF